MVTRKRSRERGRTKYCIDREDKIIELLAEGKTIAAICKEFYMTSGSMKDTIHQLKRRKGAKTSAHLVAIYLKEKQTA
jgi:DNA-binding NarL/FixJ family response regulator